MESIHVGGLDRPFDASARWPDILKGGGGVSVGQSLQINVYNISLNQAALLPMYLPAVIESAWKFVLRHFI
jgi:hypothetical protein